MNTKLRNILSAAACAAIAMPLGLQAQSLSLISAVDPVSFPAYSSSSTDARSADASPAVVVSTASIIAPEPKKPLTDRWLDLQTLSHSERYRNQYGDEGLHYFKAGQQRSLVVGKFKFDRDGKVSLGFLASSGRTFNWSFSDYAGRDFAEVVSTPSYVANQENSSVNPGAAAAVASDPAGAAELQAFDSAGWDFYPRQLFLSVAPVKQVTFEFGSFGIEKGFSTEITSFDDDGYIAGERIRIKDPGHLFFDQVTLTSAYFGDFTNSNLLGRGDSFSKSNYRQIAVRKQLSPRVGVSGEYNWISNNAHTHTVREAMYVDTRESKIFDKVRLEAYEKLNDVQLEGNDQKPRQGVSLTGEKKIGKFSGDLGFASINRDYGIYIGSNLLEQIGFSLNGDNYNTGIRYFSHVSYKINPVVNAFGFYTHNVGNNGAEAYSSINTQGLNAGLSFDLKALVNSEKQVF